MLKTESYFYLLTLIVMTRPPLFVHGINLETRSGIIFSYCEEKRHQNVNTSLAAKGVLTYCVHRLTAWKQLTGSLIQSGQQDLEIGQTLGYWTPLPPTTFS